MTLCLIVEKLKFSWKRLWQTTYCTVCTKWQGKTFNKYRLQDLYLCICTGWLKLQTYTLAHTVAKSAVHAHLWVYRYMCVHEALLGVRGHRARIWRASISRVGY